MGIGKQMALLLAQQKCKITIVDINTEEGKKTQEEIKKINQQVEYIYCDVSNQESVQKAALQSTQKFGNVDILINNAGIVVGKHILETSCKAVENTIKINAISHFYTIKEFLPKMVENNKGHIVTIASILGHMSVSQLADYCASKFAAVGLNEGLRMELNIMNSEVKTTCVCPYQINTGMFKGTSPPKLIQKLVPELDEVYVAKRVIQGIRQDEEMIIMPVSLYFAVFIKSFLPVWLIDAIVQIGGINGSVTGFVGRGKKE